MAGFALLPQAVMIAIGGVLAPALLRFMSSNALTVVALAMQAVGLVWLATDPASFVVPLAGTMGFAVALVTGAALVTVAALLNPRFARS